MTGLRRLHGGHSIVRRRVDSCEGGQRTIESLELLRSRINLLLIGHSRKQCS